MDTRKFGRLLATLGALVAAILIGAVLARYSSPGGVNARDDQWYRERMVHCFTGSHGGHLPIYCPAQQMFFPLFWGSVVLGVIGVFMMLSAQGGRSRSPTFEHGGGGGQSSLGAGGYVPAGSPGMAPGMGMPAPAEAVTWYLARDGQTYGPFTDADVRMKAAQGLILPHDQLWRTGAADWQPASRILASSSATRPFPLPPTHAPHGGAAAAASTTGNTTATIGIVFAVLGLIPPVGIGLAIIGFVLGLVARVRASAAGNAKGAKLGAISMVIAGITFAIMLVVVTLVMGTLTSLRR